MNTRSEVKELAQKIEVLAKQLSDKLDDGGDFLAPANELAMNNLTLVFTLGEIWALEQSGVSKKKVKATKISTPRNYHNVRDAQGRFTTK